MGVMMGPNGQLINTSNMGGVVGSNLIPNITPNIGALSQIDRPITNDDGTITLPTIQMKSNDPGLEAGQLQKVYGTALMPYFNWVEAQQTGSYTYDPAEELSKINEDFENEHGINAEEAAAQMKAAQDKATQAVAGATAAKFGSAFAQSQLGGAQLGEATVDAAGSLIPFKGMFKGPEVAQPNFLVDGEKLSLTAQDAIAYKDLGSKVSRIPVGDRAAPKVDAMAAGMNRLRVLDSGQQATIGDRLYGTSAAGANLKMTGYAAGADFITQVAMGADVMDAAKSAGKAAVLSYMANAIIPGSGPIVSFFSRFL